MTATEPPIDQVLRHLSRASDVARKRRLVKRVRERVGDALAAVFTEIERQRLAGRRK